MKQKIVTDLQSAAIDHSAISAFLNYKYREI